MTLCNINQGRRSFFLAHGLQNDSKTLKAVLGQAYFGVTPELVSLTWMFTNTEFYRKSYLNCINGVRSFFCHFPQETGAHS